MKKENKDILVFSGIVILSISGYFFYKKYSEYKVIEEEQNKIAEENKLKAKMREKYKDINNVDDFINGVKYLDNNAPFGYNLDALESKKYFLSTVNFPYLKEVYRLLSNGLTKNTEQENNMLMEFLPKIFLN
jgi:hypothetical protein